MRRREFITLLGALTAPSLLWPFAAHAQQTGLVRRVGVLMTGAESDEQGQLRVAAFRQGLAKLGWIEGRNLHVDVRWGGADVDGMHRLATELVDLRPDALLAGDTTALASIHQATRSIPIVFTTVSDPIGGGFVASLAHPGGNVTGFISAEAPLAGKWLELLKGIAGRLRKVALLFNPAVDPYAGEFFRHAEAAASALSLEVIAAPVHDDTEIEAALSGLAHEPNGGLIVMPEVFTRDHRQRIIAAAAERRVPAIYPYRYHAMDGGLISYGIDVAALYRQAASYVDRILRGEKPADLPVQAPTKFELVINLKTAKALGLDVSQDMLSIADEVIE